MSERDRLLKVIEDAQKQLEELNRQPIDLSPILTIKAREFGVSRYGGTLSYHDARRMLGMNGSRMFTVLEATYLHRYSKEFREYVAGYDFWLESSGEEGDKTGAYAWVMTGDIDGEISLRSIEADFDIIGLDGVRI